MSNKILEKLIKKRFIFNEGYVGIKRFSDIIIPIFKIDDKFIVNDMIKFINIDSHPWMGFKNELNHLKHYYCLSYSYFDMKLKKKL